MRDDLDRYRREFEALFSDGLSKDFAASLARVTMQYADDCFVDHLYHRRILNTDTWLRDLTITALVFLTEEKFHLEHKLACHHVAEAGNKAGHFILTDDEVEDIAHENLPLLIKLKQAVQLS